MRLYLTSASLQPDARFDMLKKQWLKGIWGRRGSRGEIRDPEIIWFGQVGTPLAQHLSRKVLKILRVGLFQLDSRGISVRTSLLLPPFPHRPLCTCSCYCFTRLHNSNQANSISHTSVPKTITKSPRGADGNVYPWQGDQLCWHLERTGLELRLKSMNGARVRPRPPLCIIAFKVSEPYHEQRAHLLRQQHRKAKMRTKGLSFGPSSGL